MNPIETLDETIKRKQEELSARVAAKAVEIEATRAEQTRMLRKISDEVAAGTSYYHKRDAAREASVVGQLGLDPDGVLSSVVNIGASVVAGTGRLAGHIGSLPYNMAAQLELDDITQEEYGARDRKVKGQSIPGDKAILGRRRNNSSNDRALARGLTQSSTGPTVDERFDLAERSRVIASKIISTTDLSSLVHQGDRDKLNEAFKDNLTDPLDQYLSGGRQVVDANGVGDVMSGLGNIISGGAKIVGGIGKTAISNPQAVFEYTAENLPQVGVGALGAGGSIAMATSNVGYGADFYTQGINEYKKKNAGAYPNMDERLEMGIKSAGLAIAEMGGDLVQLKPLESLVGAKPRISAMDSARNIVRATASGATGEFATELTQTALENDITGKPSSAIDNLIGGAIGGLSGGKLSGSFSALAEISKTSPEHIKDRTLRANAAEEFKKAAESNDPSVFLDNTSDAYSPYKAIGVLLEHVQNHNPTPEVKQANLERAGQLINSTQDTVDTLQERVNSYSEEAVEQLQANITNIDERIVTAKETNDPKLEVLTKIKANLEEQLVESNNPEAKSKAEVALSKATRELDVANHLMNGFNTATQESITPEEVTSNVVLANSGASEESSSAVEKVINLSMRSDSTLSVEDALLLVNNKSNGLSEDQRDHFRKFSEARIAQNELQDMGKVSATIYAGDTNHAGIATWESRMAVAVKSNNERMATKAVTGISNFAEDHESKARAAEKALSIGLGTVIMKKAGSLEWVTLPRGTRITSKQKAENGALTINSENLVKTIRTEADALTKSTNLIKSSFNLKFGVDSASSTKQQQSPKNISTETNVEPQTRQEVTNVTPQKTDTQNTKEDPSIVAISPSNANNLVEGTPNANENSNPVEVLPDEINQVNEPQVDGERSESSKSVVSELDSISEGSTSTAIDILGLKEKATPKDKEVPYNQRNLVADKFTQELATEKGTARPLVSKKGFLAALADNIDLAREFLDNSSKELTEAQVAALSAFTQIATDWESIIQNNLDIRNPDYRYEDYVQFLLNEDGKLDPNVATAISFAVYTYIAENASLRNFNDNKNINAMLFRVEDHAVTEVEQAALINIGMRQGLVVDSIGNKIYSALGLSTKGSTTLNSKSQLTSSLGNIGIMLMDSLGLIERNTMSDSEFSSLLGKESTPNSFVNHNFISFVRDENDHVTEELKVFNESLKGSQGILDKVFNTESYYTAPSYTPIETKQITTKSSISEVATKQAEIISNYNKKENFVRTDMINIIKNVSAELFQRMAGTVEEEDATVQITKRLPTKAKNDSIIRDYNNLMEFLSTHPEGKIPVFFKHIVWKQQRVGIATNLVNPQTSKLVRSFFYKEAGEAKIAFSNSDQMLNFKLRIAEGLGVSTDKKSKSKAIAEVEAKLASPEIKAAVAELRFFINNPTTKLTPEREARLEAGVNKGGEKIHSLSALASLAAMAEAKAKGEESFISQFSSEVDGVTNGPMITLLLLGAFTSFSHMASVMAKGGFFKEGTSHKDFNVWRDTIGNLDLYESLVRKLVDSLPTDPKSKTILSHIYRFTGDLVDENDALTKDGRNIIKTPLTAVMFGSGVNRSIESMKENFIKEIYNKIQDKKLSEQEIKDALLGLGVVLNKEQKSDSLMELILTRQQEQTLGFMFESTIGVAAKNIIETEFESLLSTRALMNKSVSAAFTLYNTVREHTKEVMLADILANKKGDIKTIVSQKGKVVETLYDDLTSKQEKELDIKVMSLKPLVQTMFSNESNQSAAGMFAAKSSRKSSMLDQYKTITKFKKNLSDGKKSILSRGMEYTYRGPGVAMLSAMIHSTDAHIALTADPKGDSLYLFDALSAGVDALVNTGKQINQATFNTLLKYSPAREIHNTFMNTVHGLATMIKEGKVDDVLMLKLVNEVKGFQISSKYNVITALDYYANSTLSAANNADTMKLTFMSELEYISQYAIEGGSYEVTADDRLAALSLRDKLATSLTAANEKDLGIVSKEIAKFLNKKNETKESTAPLLEIEDAIDEESISELPFQLGKPNVTSDSKLLALFNSGTASAETIINHLISSSNKPFNKRLLSKLSEVITSGLTLSLVSKDTSYSSLLEMGKANSRAWYVSKMGQEQIYLLGEDFVDSAITEETLIHELLHAALARTVSNAYGDIGTEVNELVLELEALRVAVVDHVTKEGTLSQYANALVDVDELISWGLSNEEFQNLLKEVEFTSTTNHKSNSLLDGMKSFINAIASLIFGKSKTQNDNKALNTLLTNVAGLINKAGKNINKGTTTTLVNNMVNNSALNTYTTFDIFSALELNHNGVVLDQEFSTHLKTILTSIVNKVYGPFGSFKEQVMRDRNISPEAVYAEAIATGAAPYVTEALSSNIPFTNQEAFVFDQVEATVRTVIDMKESTMHFAYSELKELYDEMRTRLSAKDFFKGDLSKATSTEKAIAQGAYDFIFNIESNGAAKSQYLARFAAMALANKDFNSMLNVTVNKKVVKDAVTVRDKIIKLWTVILDFVSLQLSKSRPSQPINKRIKALVVRLSIIESDSLSRLDSVIGLEGVQDAIDDLLMKGRTKVKNQLGKIASLPVFDNNSSGFVRGAAGLVKVYGNQRVRFFMEAFEKFRDDNFKSQLGVSASLLNEMRGAKDSNVVFHFLLRHTKLLEGRRKDLSSWTAKGVLTSFNHEGNDLTDFDKASITKVLLRADVQSLLGHKTLDEINLIVSSKETRDKAIKEIEDTLKTLPSSKFNNFYFKAAKALGYKMAVGKVTNEHLLFNAENISKLVDTKHETKIKEKDAKVAEVLIDQLVTLRAISYMGSLELAAASKVLSNEINRADGGNGVDMLLNTHKELQRKSKEELFSGTTALFYKGYTPEVYDPNVSILVADATSSVDLLAQGYKQLGLKVGTDATEKNPTKQHMYVIRDGGLRARVTGIFSFKSMTAKGNSTVKGKTTKLSRVDVARIKKAKEHAIDDMFTNSPFDPASVKETYYAPIVNAQGKAVDYRYMMEEGLKDNTLMRDNRFDVLMGVMAASIFDKVSSVEQNERAVRVLHAQWKLEFAENPKGYMIVGPRSTDPELREIYTQLPNSTKEAIKSIWGTDEMVVRRDILDLNFGYKKLTAASIFDEDAQLNFVQSMMAEVGKAIWKDRAKLKVGQYEDIWQEVIKATKSNFVVKSWMTLTGNLRSNWSQLILMGVSPIKIMRGHKVALQGLLKYNEESQELFNLQAQLDTGYLNPGMTEKEVKHRINSLTDSIARNPVTKLINEGLLPTIAEDIEDSTDIYSTKSKFQRSIKGYTDALNPNVVAAGKFLLMTEDSAPYKAMSFITQSSDFLARYTLYEHLTEKKDSPMSHEKAVQYVSDAFINYDIPTHRSMQYANEMGLFMFTKYYVRIQKMIGRLFKDHPGRVMAMLAAEHMFGDQPTVIDSSVLLRLGNNPFNLGVLEYGDSLDGIATVQLITAPFK